MRPPMLAGPIERQAKSLSRCGGRPSVPEGVPGLADEDLAASLRALSFSWSFLRRCSSSSISLAIPGSSLGGCCAWAGASRRMIVTVAMRSSKCRRMRKPFEKVAVASCEDIMAALSGYGNDSSGGEIENSSTESDWCIDKKTDAPPGPAAIISRKPNSLSPAQWEMKPWRPVR